jgi:hypothetical protein
MYSVKGNLGGWQINDKGIINNWPVAEQLVF